MFIYPHTDIVALIKYGCIYTCVCYIQIKTFTVETYYVVNPLDKIWQFHRVDT